MKTKILVIGVIRKDNTILMRKKPEGSKPYKETWYSFGAELNDEETPEKAFLDWVDENLNINIEVKERFDWDSEVKVDHDGEKKRFIYLDILCDFVSGDPEVPEGAEKIDWLRIDQLDQYDIVPPSVELFKNLGYLQ